MVVRWGLALLLVVLIALPVLTQAAGRIKLSGKPEVGQLIKAKKPKGQKITAYLWQQRCAKGGWQTLKGKSPQLRLVASQIGCQVRLRAKVKRGRKQKWQLSAPTEPVSARVIAPRNPPTSKQEGDVLVVDPGDWGQDLQVFLHWQRCDSNGENCQDINGATDAKYEIVPEDEGHLIRAVLTVTDQYGSRHETIAATIGPIPYMPPSNLGPPEVSGTPKVSQTLTSTEGSWRGQGARTLSYRWQRCTSSCEAISGPAAAAASYTLGDADYGARLRIEVRLTTPGGTATTTSGETATISGEAPTNSSAPTISGTARVGQTLIGMAGAWPAAAPAITSWDWIWQRCEADGSDCADIADSGGTSTGSSLPTISDYLVKSADAGQRLRLRISATNLAGTTRAYASLTDLISQAPAIISAPTISGTAQRDSSLTGTVGIWSAWPDIASWSWTWLRCNNSDVCLPIDGSAGSASGASAPTITSYKLAPADVGNTIRLRVSATNPIGTTTTDSDPSGVVSVPASFSQVVSATAPLHWWRMSGTGTPIANSGSSSQTLPMNNLVYSDYTYSQSSLIPSDPSDLSVLVSGKTRNELAALSMINPFGGYPGTSAFSWAMVVKTNAGGGCTNVGYEWFLWRGPSGAVLPPSGPPSASGDDYQMYMDCSNMKITMDRCGIGATTSNTMSFGQNLLVIATYNGSTIKIFLNSATPTGTATNTCSLANNSYPLVIGSAPGFAYGRSIWGYYSEIINWNRALSDSEASDLFTSWQG